MEITYKKAEINKRTFYLHYKDIYDLYQNALRLHLQEIIDRFDYTELFFQDIDCSPEQECCCTFFGIRIQMKIPVSEGNDFIGKQHYLI